GVALGVRVVREDAGRRAVVPRDRAALGDGGAVVAGGRGVVHGSDRKRDRGRAAALGVRRAVGRAVVTGLVGEGVGRGLAAVVAVAERPVGVEGHAAVRRVAELGRREDVALGVRVVGEHAGRRAVEHRDRAALGHRRAVVAGGRGVVHRRDRKRDRGRAAALGVGRAVRRAVVAGLVGEGVARGLAAVVAVAGRPVGVEGDAAVGAVAQLLRRQRVAPRFPYAALFPSRRAVEHRDRAALGDGGAVVVGGRGVVHRRDRKRDRGRAAALAVGRAVRRPVVAGLVGEGEIGRASC